MDFKKNLNQLKKYLDYVLGRAPDEFGLIPDESGYVKIKDLLKAMHEEEGLKYVRIGHLKELQLSLTPIMFEMDEKLIRAINRKGLPKIVYAHDPPKLLYTATRKKAYPHVADKGILPTFYSKIVLSDVKEMAIRLGKRFDSEPVILTVNVHHTLETGAMISQYGDHLFLTDYIDAKCFTGPSLPKEKEIIKKTEGKPMPTEPKMPGSFTLDDSFMDPVEKKKKKRERQKRDISWKKDRRRNKRR